MALRCARAESLTETGRPYLAEQRAFYFLTAATAVNGPDAFLAGINPTMLKIRAIEMTQEEADTTIAACDTLYPLARSDAPVTLPTRVYDHTMICLAAVGYSQGLAQALKASGRDVAGDFERLAPVADFYRAAGNKYRVTGKTEADIKATVGRILAQYTFRSLTIGNFDRIELGCEADMKR